MAHDAVNPPAPDTARPPADGSAAPDSPAIRVGCAGLPPGLRRARYFERLSYLEVEGTMYQLPKAAILRRWASEVDEDSRFGLVAPQVITHKPGRRGYHRGGDGLTPEQLAQAGWFRSTDLVEQTVEQLERATEIVRPDVVLFRSPADFSPSTANRDALRRFFSVSAPPERFGAAVRVWEPQGLWEPEVAASLAAELGIVYACDPLSNDPLGVEPEFFARLPQRSAYFRLTGLGRAGQRFDEYALEALGELAAAYDRAWIVFAHADKYPDALKLRRLLDG